MNLPPVVSKQKWQAALDQHRAKEKAATRARDALAADGDAYSLKGGGMSDVTIQPQSQQPVDPKPATTTEVHRKPVWTTPKLEDVSEQVMAQPYIRFT